MPSAHQTAPVVTSQTDPPGLQATGPAHLSKDGAWQSFPEIPHLLQHVQTGLFYGTIKIGGSSIRKSLGARTLADAKRCLKRFLRRHLDQGQAQALTFKASKELFFEDLDAAPPPAYKKKKDERFYLALLAQHWPGLEDLRLDHITEEDCLGVADRMRVAGVRPHPVEEAMKVFRRIVQRGVQEQGG